MRTGIYLAVILVFSLAAGIFLANYVKHNYQIFQLPDQNSCTADADCTWGITNCCPESAGAKWDCVNTKHKDRALNCPESVICPQVLSPKPNQTCGCVSGMCDLK